MRKRGRERNRRKAGTRGPDSHEIMDTRHGFASYIYGKTKGGAWVMSTLLRVVNTHTEL